MDTSTFDSISWINTFWTPRGRSLVSVLHTTPAQSPLHKSHRPWLTFLSITNADYMKAEHQTFTFTPQSWKILLQNKLGFLISCIKVKPCYPGSSELPPILPYQALFQHYPNFKYVNVSLFTIYTMYNADEEFYYENPDLLWSTCFRQLNFREEDLEMLSLKFHCQDLAPFSCPLQEPFSQHLVDIDFFLEHKLI